MIHTLVNIGESFLGSGLAYLLIMHWHLADLWAEHHERVEARRARRRYEKGRRRENADRIRRGYRPHPIDPMIKDESGGFLVDRVDRGRSER
jgi:hypothetical protein